MKNKRPLCILGTEVMGLIFSKNINNLTCINEAFLTHTYEKEIYQWYYHTIKEAGERTMAGEKRAEALKLPDQVKPTWQEQELQYSMVSTVRS